MNSIREINLENPKDKREVIDLVHQAFPENKTIGDNLANGIWHNLAGCNAKTKVLLVNNKIVSVGIYGERDVIYKNRILKSLTVGPIATLPKFWGKGFSSQLMMAIEGEANKSKKDIIFIQGIDNYYSKFNYFPYLAKSKIEFIKFPEEIDANFSIQPLTINDIEEVSEFFELQTRKITLASKRDYKLWCWLLKYGCNTYYFFTPKKILYKSKIVGYFTLDPNDKTNIRECIISDSPEIIINSLNLIKNYLKQNSFSINTYRNSYLYCFAQKYTNSRFIEYIKSDGGSLMRILKLDNLLKSHSVKFTGNHPDFSILFSGYNIAYKVHIENGFVNFTKFLDKNNEYDIKVDFSKTPGLIFGYFENLNQVVSCNSKIDLDLVSNIFHNNCFVFQGDNF